jgi:diaminohydroxyphosphoribosylaminopyrimidine deaminase / 5-amino-6-(5-phosphoribosylamino)uracil reductase
LIERYHYPSARIHFQFFRFAGRGPAASCLARRRYAILKIEQVSARPPASGVDLPAGAINSWRRVPHALRTSDEPLPPPWDELFGALRKGTVDDLVVVGQIGQSLDGRIATTTGRSHYISGPEGLDHLHRLRSLVDAVVVGVGTAEADDPQLTVRRVPGPSPARVVIDPSGRLSPQARLLAEDGIRRIIVTAQHGAPREYAGVETLVLPLVQGRMAPAEILARLAGIGLRRVLIEGGACTLSRFIAEGCLDRLHVVVAPILLGEGRSGLALGPIDRVDQALRPPIQIHRLGADALFDCDFGARRAVVYRQAGRS